VLVVRPFVVWVNTTGSGLVWRERALIAWLAPRGIVAAAIASATAAVLEANGVEGGPELRALVFLTIACTVLLAGVTALPVAMLLGLRLPSRDVIAILGAQGLGLALGRELRKHGKQVVFLDSNPLNCRAAEEGGFNVVFGDALQERTLQRARIESVATTIGLTPNQVLNSVFVSRSRERFGVPNGYVAMSQPETGLAPELVRAKDAAMLFEGPHDVERWDVRARHGEMEIQRWVYRGSAAGETEGGAAKEANVGERLAILAIHRGSKVMPMNSRLKLAKGDVAVIAVHEVERDAAAEVIRALGFEPYDEAAEPAGP